MPLIWLHVSSGARPATPPRFEAGSHVALLLPAGHRTVRILR